MYFLKNMMFLWKLFIKQQSIPNILFASHLKSFLIQKSGDNYDEEKDVFINMTSQYLPIVSLLPNFGMNKSPLMRMNMNLKLMNLQHFF